MVAVISVDVEIDRAVAFVGITGVKNLFDQLYLLYYMARGLGFYGRRKHSETFHGVAVTVGIVLSHLHRFELFETRFFCQFVFAVVRIVLQVTHVGDVTHVTHLVVESL